MPVRTERGVGRSARPFTILVNTAGHVIAGPVAPRGCYSLSLDRALFRKILLRVWSLSPGRSGVWMPFASHLIGPRELSCRWQYETEESARNVYSEYLSAHRRARRRDTAATTTLRWKLLHGSTAAWRAQVCRKCVYWAFQVHRESFYNRAMRIWPMKKERKCSSPPT